MVTIAEVLKSLVLSPEIQRLNGLRQADVILTQGPRVTHSGKDQPPAPLPYEEAPED